MKIVKLEQRSPAWHAWRAGGIGGSEVPVIVAYSSLLLADAMSRTHPIAAYAAEIQAAFAPLGLTSVYDATPWKIWATKKGLLTDSNKDMTHINRGVKYEDAIRKRYEDKFGDLAVEACAEHDSVRWARVSFDGLLMEGAPLEIKAPGERVFAKIKASGIPAYYYPQVQYQAWIADSPHTMFYAALINESTGKVVEDLRQQIDRDDTFLAAMVRLLDFFWETYIEGDEEPPIVEAVDVGDFSGNEDWCKLAAAYAARMNRVADLKAETKRLETQMGKLKTKLDALAGVYARAEGGGVRFAKFPRRGNIAYADIVADKLPDLTTAELEHYRGNGRVEIRITAQPAKEPSPAPEANTVAA